MHDVDKLGEVVFPQAFDCIRGSGYPNKKKRKRLIKIGSPGLLFRRGSPGQGHRSSCVKESDGRKRSLSFGFPTSKLIFVVLTVVQSVLDAGDGSNNTGVVGDLAIGEGDVEVDTNGCITMKKKKKNNKKTRVRNRITKKRSNISTSSESEKKI